MLYPCLSVCLFILLFLIPLLLLLSDHGFRLSSSDCRNPTKNPSGIQCCHRVWVTEFPFKRTGQPDKPLADNSALFTVNNVTRTQNNDPRTTSADRLVSDRSDRNTLEPSNISIGFSRNFLKSRTIFGLLYRLSMSEVRSSTWASDLLFSDLFDTKNGIRNEDTIYLWIEFRGSETAGRNFISAADASGKRSSQRRLALSLSSQYTSLIDSIDPAPVNPGF